MPILLMGGGSALSVRQRGAKEFSGRPAPSFERAPRGEGPLAANRGEWLVWSTSLHEHPDYDPEEAADLRQRAYFPLHELFRCGGQLLSERESLPSPAKSTGESNVATDGPTIP